VFTENLNPQVLVMKSAKNGARFDVFENGPGRTEQARGIQLDKKSHFVSELLTYSLQEMYDLDTE
jgi:hypothetical protein